jgi:hypothetical protein
MTTAPTFPGVGCLSTPTHTRGNMSGFDWWRENANLEEAGTTVQEIHERIQRERRAVGWLHEAPDIPLTVPQAHLITQQHRDCQLEDCPRKRAAWQTLIETGRVKPDTCRNYWKPDDEPFPGIQVVGERYPLINNLVARPVEHRNCWPGPSGTEESCTAKRSFLGIVRTMGYNCLQIPPSDSGDTRDHPKPILVTSPDRIQQVKSARWQPPPRRRGRQEREAADAANTSRRGRRDRPGFPSHPTG